MKEENGGMLSLVVPAYNEEMRLGTTLDGIVSYLEGAARPFEVVVVDDGSSDATASLVAACAARHRSVRLVRHDRNMGKGRAVQTGVLAARGEYVIFTDADLSTPIDTADDFLLHLTNGTDVVVGNRRMKESLLERRQPWLREFLGRIFTRTTRFLLRSPVTDQTCGFKGFKRAAAREVFSRQRIFDWAFDAEILHIAQRKRLTVRQIPVRWHDEAGSKVHVFSACVKSLCSLLVIWQNGIAGRYQ